MKAVDEEVLRALSLNEEGLSCKELFRLCNSAVHDNEISHAIANLKKLGMLRVVTERNGSLGAVYALTDAVDMTAEAEALLVNDHIKEEYSLNSEVYVIIKRLLRLQREFLSRIPPKNIDVKMQCLDKLKAISNAEILAILDDIAEDLRGLRNG